jgi:hypothetical protein
LLSDQVPPNVTRLIVALIWTASPPGGVTTVRARGVYT